MRRRRGRSRDPVRQTGLLLPSPAGARLRRDRTRLRLMRRLIVGLIAFYLLAAVATTIAEASGGWRRCGCQSDCWCRKPGLSLFRWVVPVARHRSVNPTDKQGRAALKT